MSPVVPTSDISVSKINSVSITVLRIIGSFKFLLYFYFRKLFRFSFSFQFLYHFYFSFIFSFYFHFRVYYVEDEINSTNVTTTGCDIISSPQRYLQFSAVKFQSEILSTYIYSSYAHIMYFKVIRITVTSPSDFSMLENFHREMHS